MIDPSELTEAIRFGNYLIDVETGEVLSEHDVGIDTLTRDLKDALEQEKSWAQVARVLKSAVDRALRADNTLSTETPSGVARIQKRTMRTAKVAAFREQARQYHLSDRDIRRIIAECAATLDCEALKGELSALELQHPQGRRARRIRAAIVESIDEKVSVFVTLQPIRKTAPRPERIDSTPHFSTAERESS